MPQTRKSVDSLTISTIWHYLQRVCVDMRETMERTATNVLATSLHDLAYGIWDADARIIAIPEGFPCRLISSTYPIKAIIKNFKGNIYPGDEFLTNHPFKAGAAHLPDWVFIRPVFYKNKLVFFSCMGTHVPDNGGAQAGTHFLANDSIAEGLNIPPIKIMEKGHIREDVLELILSNNRLPDMMRREIHSLMGSTSVAEKKLVELLDRYGKQTVLGSIEEMIQRTEKAVRSELIKWTPGVYFSEAKTDDDGLDLGIPVTVRCMLTIRDGEATFDFSGSDKQCKGYINAVFPLTMSNTLCTVFLFLGTELAAYHNEGSLKPFKIIAKEGTITNCNPGSLTAATPGVTGGLIIEAVYSVLSQAIPDRAIAAYARSYGLGTPVGLDPRTNQLYVYTTFCPKAGAGAVSGYDGYQCCCDQGTLGVVSKTDVEEEMVRFPWRTTKYEFHTDSAGAGKWRGAPGILWEGVNEGLDCVSIGGALSGWATQGQGQQGGMPTPFNRRYLLAGNEKRDISNAHITQKVKTGDHIISLGGGGAGVGRPEERDPEAVRMDVKNELVSLEAAKNIYKVILDPESLEVNTKATQHLRVEPHKKQMGEADGKSV
jgi:N-methylhydantoinase B